MSYQVTARKWRPQTFDEVVFQDHVSKTLKNSIEKGRISHAYLFSGPRGVGKTTMARILAKSINCETGPTPTPCGECNNCREIRNTTSFDVIEIDGASNNSVEDVRELRENVNFAPIKSRYKVYIIDEVHMLSPSAFNALLKTLEEPPPHIVFIFATTEIHKIPDTILSRCQKYFFKKIPVDTIVGHLNTIVRHEGLRISEKALYPIARAAEGSMRDAQSLLDQVISFSDQGRGGDSEIGEEDALSILGIVPLESYITLLGAISDADASALMQEVHRVTTLGVDIPRYVNGFVDVLRTIRLLRNGVAVHELLGLSRDETGMIRDITGGFYDEELSMMFRIAGELQSEIRYSSNERINLEMSLLDMVAVKKAPTLASIIDRLDDAAGGPGAQSGNESAGSSNRPEPAARPVEGKKAGAPAGAARVDASAAKEIYRRWEDFLSSIRESKQYLHCILQPSAVRLVDDILYISYPGGADHTYYSRILESRNLDLIKREMSALLGRSIRVMVAPEAAAAGPSGEKKGGQNAARAEKISENVPEDPGAIPPPEEEMVKNPGASEFKPVNTTVEKIKNAFHGQIIEKGDG
ncbi:MAG: DNA polymerase III subunit gamma/tau [Spirochaetes bacterium]|nr:DNA polymerase III subunit gamma/tau [Spirochaetota bacterium]